VKRVEWEEAGGDLDGEQPLYCFTYLFVILLTYLLIIKLLNHSR